MGAVPITGVSVVIPVYNSSETLDLLISRLKPVLDECGGDYELVLVDDASRDNSWAKIQQLGQVHKWIRGIRLMRNYGQHNALLCGIRAAQKPVIVTMDDDLQNPPEEIPKLLDRLGEDADVVYGVREKERHSPYRNIASQLTKWLLQKSMGGHVAQNISPFRAFRTVLREGFSSFKSPYINIDVLLTWSSTRFQSVVVKHQSRQAGVSNYNFRKLIVHALNMITGFSILPLRFASWLGILFTFFGFLMLAYVIQQYIVLGVVAQGFTFLASSIAIFSGAQLLALGIMGEYLARIHFRLMDQPSYTVRESVNE